MPKGEIVPPRNLLEQVEGVERTLRRGRRLGAIGWLSAIFGVAQLVLAIGTNISSLDLGAIGEEWLLWSAVTLFVVAGVLINWTRFWVRQSRSPFRYTFSIAPFKPVAVPEGAVEPGLFDWLERDLAEILSKRIPRLSRLDEDAVPSAASQGGEDATAEPAVGADASHIHISADYGVRRRRDDRVFFEFTPWVRMGPPGAPSTLAHPVRFRLRESSVPDVDAYESITERIYFSVATAIYARIEEDVQEKIDLLPTASFRAAAYYYEAEDYVRSNTLDAYDKARSL